MKNLRAKAGSLAVLGLVIFLGVGLCQAETPYSYQWISLNTSTGFLGSIQAFGGWTITDAGTYKSQILSLDQSSVSGLFNLDLGIGTVKNQGSVIEVNLSNNTPGQSMPDYSFLGASYMTNNRLILGDSTYLSTIATNAMLGAGLMAVNLMTGNLNNQFTSVRLSVGAQLPQQSSTPVISLTRGEPTLMLMTNNQLRTLSVATNNEIIHQGNTKASATLQNQALKDYTGVGAVSQVAGNLNQVMNNLQVRIIPVK